MKDYLPVVDDLYRVAKTCLQPYQPELMLHITNHEEREHKKMKWHGVEALFLLDFLIANLQLTGQEFLITYIKAL